MGWYEALKDAITVAQKADNVALTRELLDAQRELLDIQAENNRLHQRIREFEQRESNRDGLYTKDNVYWRKLPNGAVDGPFCMRCLDADEKLIRLTIRFGDFPACSNCDKVFVNNSRDGSVGP